MSLMIEKATIKDTETILELSNVVADKHGRARNDILKENPRHITLYKLNEYVNNPKRFIVVARQNDKVIGMILCKIKIFLDDPKYKDAICLFVEDTCVADGYKKKGIGSKMMEFAKVEALKAGCSRIVCDVWDFNNESLEFMFANGFSFQKHTLECFIDK